MLFTLIGPSVEEERKIYFYLFFMLRHMVSFLLFLIFFKNQYWLISCACGCALDVLLLFLFSDTSDTIHFEGIILIVKMLTL